MSLLIVESPAKAKTISKYLGDKFKVVASFGHVRDLPAKNGSVDPKNDFTIKYVVIEKAEKYIKELIKAAKEEPNIYLATDPDREGEAIAWHVVELLKEKKVISNENNIYRIVFNEITKNAVIEAVRSPRRINMDLVNAQQARRALDYLVGFTLSPLLWKKLPGSKSAGRVQSVALRLICEREYEIQKFLQQEYWSINAEIKNSRNETFFASLSHYQGKKLEKFDIKNEKDAQSLIEQIKLREYTIGSVESKQVKRNPLSPFITSSLQQDSVNRLHLSIKNVMRIAQNLYEGINLGGETVGLITYMRTDGFYISDEAIGSIRRSIQTLYGNKYLPRSPHQYTKKVKNAQEAHEAIRPTDINRTPSSIATYLTPEQLKLYDLIWKRTIASQMESAVLNQTSVEINANDQQITLRANGSSILFDGFYKVYRDDIESEESNLLPIMQTGEGCQLITVVPKQHFTQPPPRYSEASIVKKMEEIGIGRPSTYSAIISVLQDRSYVTLDNRRFIPSNRGKIVTIFLKKFFHRYVEYDFTAHMEEELDLISNGNADWKIVMRQFWLPFYDNTDSVQQMQYDEILNSMSGLILDYFCIDGEKNDINQKCSMCSEGRLKLNIGRGGIFFGCTNYPDCQYTREIINSSKSLGIDTATGQEVVVKKGPYGFYLQFNNNQANKKKSVTIPKDMNIDNIDLNLAVELLSMPKVIGNHHETGKEIKVGIGRFGYYILYDSRYFSLKKSHKEVLNLQLREALEIIASNAHRSLGFDEQGEEILICKGKYGYYLKCGKITVALGKNNDIDLQKATELIKQTRK